MVYVPTKRACYDYSTWYCAWPGKDLKWWNQKKAQDSTAKQEAEMEKARVKQLDDDLLNEAL